MQLNRHFLFVSLSGWVTDANAVLIVKITFEPF